MKSLRWRKVIKNIKPHAITTMDVYFRNEHTLATCGVSIISSKKEHEICDTLSLYAHTLEKIIDIHTEVYEEEWVKYVYDFY